MLKRIVFILACSLLAVFVVNAQVTTSSITGTITDDKGEPLIGATVTAIHQPSGTTYMTSTKKGGGFNLPGLRPGDLIK